jgi:NtrC-family two-component system sensor histidine kinase KinB
VLKERLSLNIWVLAALGVTVVLSLLVDARLALLPAIFFAGLLIYQERQIDAQRRQIDALKLNTEAQVQQKRVVQLSTLNRVLALLTDTLSPDTVIDTVISSASTVSESATAVAVFLLADDKSKLERSVGLSQQFCTSYPTPLLVDNDIRQPMMVANLTDTSPELRAIMVREGKAAWIELPLVFRGVRVGVLGIYYNQPQDFSAVTIEMLRTFANQCAQAISNARLYAITDEALEQRVGQLLALANIGHHLTATLEVRAICDLVASYTRASSRADAAAILLIDENGEVEQWAAYGYPAGAVGNDRQLTDGGISGKAIKLRDTVMVGDVQKEPGYVNFLPDTRSQLSTPILWNESVVGVITLESSELNAFSEEDRYFVQQLANQTIIAIENARLFKKVSEARDRMQVILNTVKEGLILISTAGKVVLVNPRIELIGLDPDVLMGRTLDDLLEENDLGFPERLGFRTGSEIQRLVKELRAPGGLAAREPKVFTFEAETEIRYVQRQVFPIYDDTDQPLGVLLVFYDETEEMKLAKTREDVSQMLIHDLRSPLTSVTTALKLLTELTPKDSEYRGMIEMTADASRRSIRTLLNRVDALLDVARMESAVMKIDTKPSELATLVDNVCIELSPVAKELNIGITSTINGEMPLLEIDADKVERLLLNLVDNALKFSPSDSRVLVRSYAPGSEGAAPGFIRVDVVDAGPGVPDEYKLLLFDRYTQIRGRTGTRRGSGLGLTFCRLVAETHGGRIWIDDNPGGGSIFAFTLPLAEQGAVASSASD